MRWMCHDVSASSRRKEGAVVRRDKGLESDWGREFTGCIQLAKLSPNTSPGICQDVAMSTLCSVSQGTCQAEEPDSETSPLPLPGCLQHLPWLPKTFEKCNVLALQGLPISHMVLPLEDTPVGITVISSGFVNHRGSKQARSLLRTASQNHCLYLFCLLALVKSEGQVFEGSLSTAATAFSTAHTQRQDHLVAQSSENSYGKEGCSTLPNTGAKPTVVHEATRHSPTVRAGRMRRTTL
ncbi:hypothetical protein Anapl_04985 [Anas platyrhynchos]|uniref:Uncharacterized protein n=1 Tax=Anas platyrhynchos TaxID=8839 RepID=R0LW19_ANAPL|nr:hypothetical protein Anapl_04985 [Anas platyrhynchos]